MCAVGDNYVHVHNLKVGYLFNNTICIKIDTVYSITLNHTSMQNIYVLLTLRILTSKKLICSVLQNFDKTCVQ